MLGLSGGTLPLPQDSPSARELDRFYDPLGSSHFRFHHQPPGPYCPLAFITFLSFVSSPPLFASPLLRRRSELLHGQSGVTRAQGGR